jgi:GT2 family glycosyltransferase
MTSTDTPLVYIITLDGNRIENTLEFLESCGHLSYPRAHLLVVNNAPSEISAAAIAARFPHAEQLTNARNLGFAAGMNVGMQHALQQGADYVFLANNDTSLAADALALLVDAALAQDADLAAPAIYYADNPHCIWSLGGWRRRMTLEITARKNQTDVGQEPFEVDYVSGCGMLIRRRCLETIGLLDERFFMYYEDSDYCLRVRAAGCRAIVVPRARMWHKVAATIGGVDSPRERYYMALSSLQFFKKHVRGRRWLVVMPYRAASAVKTVLRLLLRGHWLSAVAYLHGLWDGVVA